MGSIENWLIEGRQDADADIRSDTIQDLKRDMATKGCCGDVVKEITHTYWMVSNQHWAGALVLFMMVLVQALVVIYHHSAGFWFWW